MNQALYETERRPNAFHTIKNGILNEYSESAFRFEIQPQIRVADKRLVLQARFLGKRTRLVG